MQPERVIESEILSWLASQDILAFKIKTTASYDPKTGAYWKTSKYYKKGTADILGIYKGRPLAIEVKTKTGRLSPHQKIFLQEWKNYGGISIVARSIEDVDRGLHEGLLAITNIEQAKST